MAVVGSRDCKDFDYRRIMAHLPDNCTMIVSGGADGVDGLARRVARERRIPLCEIKPDYRAYGKNAPLIRNREIVRKADLVLAFWDFQSRGTAYTIVQCIEQNVPVRVFGLEQDAARSQEKEKVVKDFENFGG